MERIENRCVGCADGLGCLGISCPNRNVRVIYCDCCKEELEEEDVYCVDGKDLCEDCLKDMFRKGG